jgi:hypothetical protein
MIQNKKQEFKIQELKHQSKIKELQDAFASEKESLKDQLVS